MRKFSPKIINRTIISLIMFGFFFGLINALPWSTAKADWKVDNSVDQNQPIIDPFANLNLRATSAIVMNIETGEVIFALKEKEQMPLASVTKVMTALTAIEMSGPETTITVSHNALSGGSNAGIGTGRWALSDILDFSLVTSSNGASNAVAETLKNIHGKDFVIEMNNTAERIGLNDSYFINPSGLDVGGDFSGSYGTAYDIARLFSYTLKHQPGLLEATRHLDVRRPTLDGTWYSGRNTNQTVGEIPGILASKTGFTDAAGGNLAVAFDAGLNQPYVAVVLGGTRQSRFDDIKSLVRATIRHNSLEL